MRNTTTRWVRHLVNEAINVKMGVIIYASESYLQDTPHATVINTEFTDI